MRPGVREGLTLVLFHFSPGDLPTRYRFMGVRRFVMSERGGSAAVG